MEYSENLEKLTIVLFCHCLNPMGNIYTNHGYETWSYQDLKYGQTFNPKSDEYTSIQINRIVFPNGMMYFSDNEFSISLNEPITHTQAVMIFFSHHDYEFLKRHFPIDILYMFLTTISKLDDIAEENDKKILIQIKDRITKKIQKKQKSHNYQRYPCCFNICRYSY